MLLSKSELFWVGLLSGMLSQKPVNPPDEEGYGPFEYPPPTVYDQVMQLAEACAIGHRPNSIECDEPTDGIDIDALLWAKHGRDPVPMSSFDVRQAITSLTEATADLRSRLTAFDVAAAAPAMKRFDELVSEDDALLYGYTPSSPGVLYGVRINGELRIVRRVSPIAQGTLRHILRILLPHVAMPPVALMSLASAGDPVPAWHEDWIPSSWSLHRPFGATDRLAASKAIEDDLVGGLREDAEFRLGNRLGAAIAAFEWLQPWLDYEMTTLHYALSNTRVTDFIPTQPSAASVEEGAESDAPHDIDAPSGDVDIDPAPVENDSSDSEEEGDAEDEVDWAGIVGKAFVRACTQVGLGVAVPTLESPTKPILTKIQGDLQKAIAAAKNLALDPAIAGLNSGVSLISDVLREDDDRTRLPPGTLLKNMFDHRDLLGHYADRLRGLLGFVFGELRLGELLHDGGQRGLAAESFAGWMGFNGNIRDSVRIGMEMLSKGESAFAIINTLQPALESIIRSLAEAHRTSGRRVTLHDALQGLLDHALTRRDKELESHIRIAMALRRLRNGAVHEHHRTYDKHDAVFFAHGLAILLRAVS